jgi:hypothetical protein
VRRSEAPCITISVVSPTAASAPATQTYRGQSLRVAAGVAGTMAFAAGLKKSCGTLKPPERAIISPRPRHAVLDLGGGWRGFHRGGRPSGLREALEITA